MKISKVGGIIAAASKKDAYPMLLRCNEPRTNLAFPNITRTTDCVMMFL